MSKRQFDTEAPIASKSDPVQETEAPDREVSAAADYALPPHGAWKTGGAPRPESQAMALARASGGQLARAGHALLQLQRNYGNHYVQRMVNQARHNRTGLPDHLKSGIESLSGMALDDVHVHFNSPKPAQVQALAYTQGTEIHVAPGQEQHLAHEAWHVVQQAQGRVKPTMQMKDGVAINDDAGLEHEAEVMGAKAKNEDGQTSLTAEPTTRTARRDKANVGLVQRVKRDYIPDKEWDFQVSQRSSFGTRASRDKVSAHYDQSLKTGKGIKEAISNRAKLDRQQDVNKETEYEKMGYQTIVSDKGSDIWEMNTTRLIKKQQTESTTIRVDQGTSQADSIEKLWSQNLLLNGARTKIKKVNPTTGIGIYPTGMGEITVNIAKISERVVPSGNPFGGEDMNEIKYQVEVSEVENAQGLLYYNYLNASDKTLLAEKNYKETNDIPRLSSSEILWQQYKAVQAKRGEKLRGGLKIIRRVKVDNDQTRDTIFMTAQGRIDYNNVTFNDAKDDDFWAILGTPNGNSAGWLVAQHGEELGIEKITKIVVDGKGKSIVLEIHYGIPDETEWKGVKDVTEWGDLQYKAGFLGLYQRIEQYIPAYQGLVLGMPPGQHQEEAIKYYNLALYLFNRSTAETYGEGQSSLARAQKYFGKAHDQVIEERLERDRAARYSRRV